MSMETALRVINALEAEGIIGRYAIGGAIGLVFYAEPIVTFDLDIFCHLPHTGILVDLRPVYDRLATEGYAAKGECVVIDEVPVQFLPPVTALVEEALNEAKQTLFAGVPTRVFQYEHLLAILVETGRPKDRAKLATALESCEPNRQKLEQILSRHGLLDKWNILKA